MLKLAIVGSRYFGATVFEALRQEPGVQIARVVTIAADDRLALAANQAGVPVTVQADPKKVSGAEIGGPVDLIVAAHTHARVLDDALALSKLGGVGYHPSLLPRHRGIAAVEWTVLEGDPIAGGSVYHLAAGWDAGAIAAQDWTFVLRGEDARSLWERALAPMGIRLLTQVVREARDTGQLRSDTQDPRFATRAPMLRKAVVQAPAGGGLASLVVTVMGPDRPGIVRAISECAQRHGANWATGSMSRIAGEFAGTVLLEVATERAAALSEALRALAAGGLQVVIADSSQGSPARNQRSFELKLVGEDRVGIVAKLAHILAERGISIETLHTETQHAGERATFHVAARLLGPAALDLDGLRTALGELAQAIMADIALDESTG